MLHTVLARAGSSKRVRAAGPETRLTGHSAKVLTQDTHCLPCQLPEDLLSHSLPQSAAELGGGRVQRGRRGPEPGSEPSGGRI